MDKESAMKLYHEELDIISELTLTYTGVKIYNKSRSKKEKVKRLISNFHNIPISGNATNTNVNYSSQQSMSPKHYFNVLKRNCYINIIQKHF